MTRPPFAGPAPLAPCSGQMDPAAASQPTQQPVPLAEPYLWPFGAAPRDGAPASEGAAAARALPPDIAALVVDHLGRHDTRSLRLAHSTARAAVDARLKRVNADGVEALRALRAALERGAAGSPHQFPAVSDLALVCRESAGRDKTVPEMAAIVRALRALPALRSLHLNLQGVAAQELAVAVLKHIGESAPLLETASLQCLAPEFNAVLCCCVGAALPQLRALKCHTVSPGQHELTQLAVLRAGLDPATSFQRLQELDIGDCIVPMLECALPALTRLQCRGATGGTWLPPVGTWPFRQLAAAPCFAHLQVLRLEEYHGRMGDLAGCCAPSLIELDIGLRGSAAVNANVAALGRLAMPALRRLCLRAPQASGERLLARSSLAALLAAPGLAGALETFELHSGWNVRRISTANHPAHALAAARLPALRAVKLVERRAELAAEALALVASAPWAPQLASLEVAHREWHRQCDDIAAPALSALAQVSFTQLRRLDVSTFDASAAVLADLLRTPWVGTLEELAAPLPPGDEEAALCAASPAFAALRDAGRARFGSSLRKRFRLMRQAAQPTTAAGGE